MYEKGLGDEVTSFLSSRGHKLDETEKIAVVQGVARGHGDDGRVYANADWRKSGGVAGF
jgi:hypothetical protein